MSRYNHMESIPVDSVPKEEIAQAIKEWAEGCESLERFLWACYNSGIKTEGSHAGASSYVDFLWQGDADKITNLLNVTQNTLGGSIIVESDGGGNPFSGSNWDKPHFTIGFHAKDWDEVNTYFSSLSESIENNSNDKKVHPLQELLDFFSGKESYLAIRFDHPKESTYLLQMGTRECTTDRYNYYNEILTQAGLTRIKTKSEDEYIWQIESDNLEDLMQEMEYATQYITNNYILGLPESEEELNGYTNRIAHFKKRTLPEEEYNKWFEDKKQRYEERLRRMKLEHEAKLKQANQQVEDKKDNVNSTDDYPDKDD